MIEWTIVLAGMGAATGLAMRVTPGSIASQEIFSLHGILAGVILALLLHALDFLYKRNIIQVPQEIAGVALGKLPTGILTFALGMATFSIVNTWGSRA